MIRPPDCTAALQMRSQHGIAGVGLCNLLGGYTISSQKHDYSASLAGNMTDPLVIGEVILNDNPLAFGVAAPL